MGDMQTVMQETLIPVMIDAKLLIEIAERNLRTLMRQLNGLTHEQSLLQPPFRGNCLNWVVGHLVTSRERMLLLVEAEPVWTEEQRKRYERGSEPVTAGSDALHFDQIVAAYETTHHRLITRLQSVTQDELNVRKAPYNIPADPEPVWDWLQFLLWHETYHIGNTELLRQLAGTNDKVI
ncbi:MAG: DinB family protein [Anaerolineae bacterium]